MADPFQPRFVDLVRNFTTTQGTGNFVLGPVVNGFANFGSALQVGDSFYYSAIGVDKPAEREIGRGTLQSNGSISRVALGGTPTNFSSGTKSIALIAPAEWFNTIQAGAGSLPVVAANRGAIASATSHQVPALLTEAGREGLFAFDGSNLSSRVATDNRQGVVIAPTSDPTGASGAWVRKYSGAVNVRWFGAVGNDTTDDGPAFTAALNYLKSIAYGGFGYGIASPSLFVPFGTYFLGATTLDLTHTVIIEGESVGEAGGGATILRWAANTTGIRVQRLNTNGATGVDDGNTHKGGDASVISRLTLKGAYSNLASEGEHHAIHLRARATIRDVYINNFQGDGVSIIASGGAGVPTEGNANSFEITRMTIENCRNGLFVQGADTNAGHIQSLSSIGCRQWGVWDRSFLGNTYTGCHTASNGVVANVTPTLVHLSGRLFYVKPGQAGGASTNSPPANATDNAYWGYARDGVVSPAQSILAWTNGLNVREGGAYCTDSLSASHVFTNCYSEMDQAPSRYSQNTLILNGLQPAGVTGGARIIASQSSTQVDNLLVTTALRSEATSSSFGRQTGGVADTQLYLDCTNLVNGIALRSWFAGNPTTDGQIFTLHGFGQYYDTPTSHRLRIAGFDVVTVGSAGLNLEAGKALSANGTAVIDGSRNATVASLASTGPVSGSNLSGTNTGDQTIILTGDITGSGGGSFAATISAGAVSLSKMANLAANSLIGNSSGSAAAPAALSAAQTRSLLGLATIATSGSGADLGASSVTYAKVQNVSATAKLLGRASAGAGVVEELGLAGGLTISGTNLSLGAITPSGVAASGAMTTSSPSAGNGYATGAGGTVTQATSKSTSVTLNKVCGQVTMNAASLATASSVGFALTNSAIAATDVVVVSIASAATADSYQATVDAVAAGSCRISLRNISAASKSEAVVLNFAVCKAVNA